MRNDFPCGNIIPGLMPKCDFSDLAQTVPGLRSVLAWHRELFQINGLHRCQHRDSEQI